MDWLCENKFRRVLVGVDQGLGQMYLTGMMSILDVVIFLSDVGPSGKFLAD